MILSRIFDTLENKLIWSVVVDIFLIPFLKTEHTLAILKSFMNSPLLKDKLNIWLRATKILSGKAFNTLVGTKSKPALSLYFNFCIILEISEGHVGQTCIAGKEGTLKYSEKVVLLERRVSTSFLAAVEK